MLGRATQGADSSEDEVSLMHTRAFGCQLACEQKRARATSAFVTSWCHKQG